ncbi:hypothetical protein HMN09_00757700 [Mycena chlorophos]|uniref:Pkinase-domain-containing protein n=1 Tax=Mycena chlorophos TaxID=658473 RepID=A0A8H6W7P6_MYCCL|nr:hypothetical protein HMN09_00757700 [Mycena chlorophos]
MEEDVQETQEFLDTTVTTGCWGLLLPSTPGEERVRLLKDQLVYHVGRSAGSHIRLASSRISSTHATITWNAQMDKKSAISIRDSSKNGTWLGTRRLKPGETNTLDDKVQIRFGPTRHAPEDPAPSIYVFWDLASQKDAIHEIYDLLDIIGSGNFGTVHKARRRGDATLVAIKHIDPVKRYAGAGGERSGLQEIELLQSARHTNIVRLLEHYDNPDNSLHLVFELVENGDLETYIQHRKADRGLSEEMARHFTHQICAAVAYLHNKNIIHRDLKPANILLTAHEPPIAKVADFGVARLISEFSAAHTVAGTIHYMAPEVVTRTSKEEPYDNKVDSWSVGGILFCMFTTYPPFPVSGDSMQELIAMLQTQGRKAIRWDLLGRRTISPHADEFLKELLVYEAGGRMDLKESNSRSWFKNFQPAYSFDSNGSSLARTASWFDNSASLAEASQKAVAGTAGVLREATVDPEEPAGDAAPAAPSPKPATRARRDSSASSRRSDSKKGAAQAGPSRVPGLRAAPTEPYEEPVAAASSSKAKGKGKAKQSPVPAPVSVPLPSSTGADVPDPMSNNSSMYLYGSPAAANPQLSVVVEEEEKETDTGTRPVTCT